MHDVNKGIVDIGLGHFFKKPVRNEIMEPTDNYDVDGYCFLMRKVTIREKMKKVIAFSYLAATSTVTIWWPHQTLRSYGLDWNIFITCCVKLLPADLNVDSAAKEFQLFTSNSVLVLLSCGPSKRHNTKASILSI